MAAMANSVNVHKVEAVEAHTSNRIQNDGDVENLGLAPLVSDLLAEGLLLLIGKVVHGMDFSRILSSKGTLLQKRQDLVEIMVGSELLCRAHQSLAGYTNKRVANPAKGQ